MATREQLIEANKKAVLSPFTGKRGKNKMTLLKERALANVQKSYEEKLEQYLPDEKLLKVHSQLLNKKEIIKKFNHETGEYENEILQDQPETNAATRALDMAYKVKGKYAPQEIEIRELSLKIDL